MSPVFQAVPSPTSARTRPCDVHVAVDVPDNVARTRTPSELVGVVIVPRSTSEKAPSPARPPVPSPDRLPRAPTNELVPPVTSRFSEAVALPVEGTDADPV